MEKSVHQDDTSFDVGTMKFVADPRLASRDDKFTVDYQRSWLGGEDFVVLRERGGAFGDDWDSGHSCGTCSC